MGEGGGKRAAPPPFDKLVYKLTFNRVFIHMYHLLRYLS